MADEPRYQSIHDGETIDAAISRIRNGDLDTLTERAETAATSAQSASTAAQNASAAAVPAAAQAVASATESKSWAVGGTGSRTGEDTDNAKYYASVAREIAGGDYTTPTEARGIANQQIDARAAKLYDSTHPYAAGEWCVHAGEVWKNTSGGTVTGVEPGTNYNVWNVGYSNKNLLDNPWFTVNQRGETVYAINGYSIDRWREDGGITVSIDATGCTIEKRIIDSSSFRQIIDNTLWAQIENKQVTISVQLQDGAIYAHTRTTPPYLTAESSKSNPIGAWTYQLYSNGSQLMIRFFNTKDKQTLSIRSVKLELGPISTLANDGPPDYTTELLKCQRYFVRLSSNYNGNGNYIGVGMNDVSSSQSRIVITLPTVMHRKPSVTLYNIKSAVGAEVTLNYVGWGTQASNSYTLVLNEPSTVLSPLSMPRFGPNGYIDFSADL